MGHLTITTIDRVLRSGGIKTLTRRMIEQYAAMSPFILVEEERGRKMKQTKVTYVLVAKERTETDSEGNEVYLDEAVIHEDTRWVKGDLPPAEDVKDEKEFRAKRIEAQLKLSDVELRVFPFPFVKA
jgi:hypothetical protein